jgi:hypothetical protein
MITTTTRYSKIEMGGHFDGIHCWVATDGKEARLDFFGSIHSHEEYTFDPYVYNVLGARYS